MRENTSQISSFRQYMICGDIRKDYWDKLR